MKKIIFPLLFLLLIIINVSAQVTQEWVKTYSGPGGPGGSTDYPWSIAIDISGNVYVIGYVRGTLGIYDYATIKYNSFGVEQWARIYNGPGSGKDEAWSIAADNSGNVYVTGFSEGIGTDRDYLTIMYNSSGVEQWVQRYNGPGNSLDEAWSVAVDNSGNVYVTGGSVGTDSMDYATIKYNSFGVEQWVRRHNESPNGIDEAFAMLVDNSENIYITGDSFGMGTREDYLTIKYNSAGVEQWLKRYNRSNWGDFGRAIALDNSGNVYVTGTSSSSGINYDYATVKYNSSGVEQWVQTYNGPGNSLEASKSITVDNSGNAFVTGYSKGSGTNYDFATIKYSSSGVEEWVRRYNGPGNDLYYAYSIAADNSGNVYVTGSIVGSGTGADYATIKYNPLGVEQWVERYMFPGNGLDIATYIAVDNSGNFYITGYSYNDYTTIKYSQQVGIQQISTEIPENFLLEQNYPNPFNPTTNIKFDIPKKSFVKLVIYNSLGKEIELLLDEELKAGSYHTEWDASGYPSGVYFCRIEAEDFVETKSMLLLK